MSLQLPPPGPPPPTGTTSTTSTSYGASSSSAAGAAPPAPGRLGGTVTPQEAFAYLRDLDVWRGRRREELDGLDAAALASSERDSFSRDLLVSMALWKAVSDRYDLLEIAFDNGRVGPTQAERIAALIWGRLDVAPHSAAASVAPSTAGALALSLPEACRLLDAMTSSLRARLSLEPSGAEVGTRLTDVRQTIERVRDQVGLAPPGPARETARQQLTRLEQRLLDVTDRAKRGADVGGLLAPLELEASTAERDLIVSAGQRVLAARDAARAAQLRTELAARGEAIRLLETACVEAVTPAPRLAVPDVTALGPVPGAGDTPDVIERYLARLDAVGRALTTAHSAYADALADRDEAQGLAGALGAQARASGVPEADRTALTDRLDEVFAARPTDLRRARALTAALSAYVAAYAPPPTPGGPR